MERTMAAKKEKTLDDLFYETLKDIYYAEKTLVKALPRMAKAAESEDLAKAIEHHLQETEGQVERLEQVFEIIDKPARAKTCPAIKGLAEEAKEVMKDFKGTPALDAGLLSAAQAVEHYEISRYGTLKAWAEELGHSQAARLLDATLQEEKNADKLLTQLAVDCLNQRAEAA
jgi:ferritin-like metal-binding protein YciE